MKPSDVTKDGPIDPVVMDDAGTGAGTGTINPGIKLEKRGSHQIG